MTTTTTTSNTETKHLGTIRDDTDLQEKMSEVKEEIKISGQSERFLELEKAIHNFLSKQDSENTLKIITK